MTASSGRASLSCGRIQTGILTISPAGAKAAFPQEPNLFLLNPTPSQKEEVGCLLYWSLADPSWELQVESVPPKSNLAWEWGSGVFPKEFLEHYYQKERKHTLGSNTNSPLQVFLLILELPSYLTWFKPMLLFECYLALQSSVISDWNKENRNECRGFYLILL